jgi:hypothetical protein
MHPAPGGAATATIAPPDAGDDEEMPLPSGRGPASTKILLVMVLVAVAFMGGVLAQKKNDEGMVRPPKGPMAAFSGAIGGAGAGAGAAGAMPPGAGPADLLAAAANLKGEVVSVNGTEVVVRDQNGVERKATMGPGALVLKSGPLDSLQPGSKVLIAGKDNPDGSATAMLVVAP